MTSTPTFAVIGPFAAAWMLARASQGEPLDFDSGRRWAVGQGRVDLADQLEAARRQLVLAGACWRASQISDDGSGAPVVTETGAGSVVMEITTTEAAGLLGVGSRRVLQLRAGGALRGRAVGRSWLIDRGSVQELLSVRRTA